MRVIRADAGWSAVHAGSRLSALLFQQPGNVRAMAGADLDTATAPPLRVMASGRAEAMARHRQLMTSWAAYLDRLRGGTGDHVPQGMALVNPLFC